MGQARKTMDQITDAVVAENWGAFERLYDADVVADTPDEGRLEGREELLRWMRTFAQAFSDMSFEMIASSESDDTAIDEAYLFATHTGPLPGPEGEIAPTGKRIRLRECDAATVRNGKVVSHRFYFDQMELLTQLGVLPSTIVLPDAAGAQQPVRSG